MNLVDEIEFLESLGCDSIKIASADVNHMPLIRRAAQSGMCIQLDTGKSSIGEIEMAIDVIRADGNENIIIHHCPSGYPADIAAPQNAPQSHDCIYIRLRNRALSGVSLARCEYGEEQAGLEVS